MSTDNTTASVVSLTKLAFSSVLPESSLHDRLRKCFPLFSTILPFDSPLELDGFFNLEHFSGLHKVNTFYGTICSYSISKRLQCLHIQRSFSLQNLCLMSLIKTSPPHMSLDILLRLPDQVFQQFISKSFSILWMPMTHVLFHRRLTDRGVPVDLKVVFDFLSNVQVFDRMYHCCRNVQMFIFSWLQNAHFYSLGDSEERVRIISNAIGKSPDGPPLVPAYELSLQLLANLQELLSRTPDHVAEVIRVVMFGFKVSNFLCDCSEYVNAYKAARSIYALVRTHPVFVHHRSAQLRLEYNVLCVLLRAMNAYNMYVDPEDRQFFQKNGPNLFKSLKQHGLLLDRTNLNDACSPFVLPPSLQATNASLSDAHGTQSGACLDPTQSSAFEEMVDSPGPCGDCTVFDGGNEMLPKPVLPNCHFNANVPASSTVSDLLNDLQGPQICGAFLYSQLASYYYSMCKYHIAHQFVLLSVEQLRASHALKATPAIHVTIEVLRIMGKMCMIKRKYKIGIEIVRQAMLFARAYGGTHSLLYASLLLEYGCVMLNMDKAPLAAKAYLVSMAKILNCLPGSSLMAALALEAIAYAYYVQEYSSGDFPYALSCAELAVSMLRRLNHENCMQTSSANRVKALIIEEIAIDDTDLARARKFLYAARNLHLESLTLCERTFGLWNIQTAKHFGNLGRLYQSMQENKEAEMMHRKAIMVKERLLGASDFEVGLSSGHLASLYNYDMDRFKEAEQLYLRSVQISLNLFGPTYSGLEYDYRGLMHVYQELGNQAEADKYRSLYENWQRARENVQPDEPSVPEDELEATYSNPTDELTLWEQFFTLASEYEEQFRGVFFLPTNCTEERQSPSLSGNRASGHGL